MESAGAASASPWVPLFVPGRVCLLGEHSDWASTHRSTNPSIPLGACLVYGTDLGLFARARLATSNFFFIRSHDGSTYREANIPWNYEELIRIAKEGGFFSYTAGVAATLMELTLGMPAAPHVHVLEDRQWREMQLGPIIVDNYFTTLPVKRGLSSSAAVCVLVAQAFNELFHLGLEVRHIMELAFQGEIKTPSRCGRMDQCVAFGRACVLMEFDGPSAKSRSIRIPPKSTFHFVVADLCAGKDTKKILADLGSCYPTPKAPHEQAVHEFLGAMSFNFVAQGVAAMERGDPKVLGEVLSKAQKEFDEHLIPVCSELVAPKLHNILRDARVGPFVYGGKGVGSQGDGSIQFVCRGAQEQDALTELLNHDFGCIAFKLTLTGEEADGGSPNLPPSSCACCGRCPERNRDAIQQ